MAVISKVKIFNQALARVGTKSTIESTTEASVEANVLSQFYDTARQMSLERFNWSFARKRSTLATHSVAAPDEWAYRYIYPFDCLKARYIQQPYASHWQFYSGAPYDALEADAVPFSVELASDGTKSIVSDLNPATLIYTMDQEQVDIFSPLFVNALAAGLAWLSCYQLSGKASLEQKLEAQYERAILMAAASEANEQVGHPPRNASHIRARD